MERTTIPMPPSQWRNDLQNRIAWDCASTSIRTVAPVVVRPDMVSKTASAGVLKLPAKINGKAPNKAHAVTQAWVMAMPSRLPMRRLSLGADRSTPVTPAAAVIADERRNAAQSPSPNMSDIAAGAASRPRILPRCAKLSQLLTECSMHTPLLVLEQASCLFSCRFQCEDDYVIAGSITVSPRGTMTCPLRTNTPITAPCGTPKFRRRHTHAGHSSGASTSRTSARASFEEASESTWSPPDDLEYLAACRANPAQPWPVKIHWSGKG